jgi:hypothetical protein
MGIGDTLLTNKLQGMREAMKTTLLISQVERLCFKFYKKNNKTYLNRQMPNSKRLSKTSRISNLNCFFSSSKRSFRSIFYQMA